MAWYGAKELLFRRYLLRQARPRRLRRFLTEEAGHPVAAARGETGTKSGKRLHSIAAVQLQAKLFADPVQYAAEMHRAVSEASLAGAELIVFPEYNNLQLLGLLPGVEEMAAETLGREATPVADVFRYLGPVVTRIVNTTFSWLAERYRVYIVAGSFLVPDGDRLVNRAMLFSPNGKLIGTHDKVHLMPIEHAWGIDAGADFPVFDTDLGSIATPVCMDATFSETFRILELKGARIVALPIADAAEYNRWLALRGIVGRVQESLLYGVKSALVGRILGIHFSGRSGVFAPAALTPAGDGVLAETADPEEGGVVTADVDLAALERLREGYGHRDFNHALYARYFPDIYERRLKRRGSI